jgi:hypothetical protein
MMKALPLILSIFVMGLASPVWADCSVVSIRAQKKIGTKAYEQFGVGTVFSTFPDDQRRFIFVPAHVVNSADLVDAHCGGTTLSLEPLGVSVTSDMAVFRAQQTTGLTPLFAMDGARLSRVQSSSRVSRFTPVTECGTVVLEVVWGKEDEPTQINSTCASFESFSPWRPILGIEFSLSLHAFGVRPGMSGSPVLNKDGVAIGIVTKTRNFGTESAGLSIESLKKYLPQLVGGHDPFGPDSRWGFYITETLQPSPEGRVLVRNRQLNVGRRSNRVFKDVCPAHAYTETSAWTDVQTKAGWGDGGGSRDPRGVGGQYFRGIRKNSWGEWQQYASFRPDPDSCDGTGVRTPDGRVLIGIREPNRYLMKIESIDDLYNVLLLVGGGVLQRLDQVGLFESRPETFDQICTLKGLAREGIEVATQASTSRLLINLENRPLELWKTEILPLTVAGSNLRYACDLKSHALRVASQEGVIDFALEMTTDRIKGRFKIGNCELSMLDRRKDFWTAQIKDEHMHLEIQIPSNEKSLLQLQVHRLSPTCLAGVSVEGASVFLDRVLWHAPRERQ